MINIICGNRIEDIKNSVLEQIEKYKFDLSYQNIVVVPDRYSLIVEKAVFEQLQIKATFTIKVMGINMLAKSLIQNSNLECVFVDAITSDFLMYRAVQNTKKDFVCFSKTISVGLVEKIKEGISLVMSSGITPEQLLASAENKSENMQKKIFDIAKVMTEYLRLLDCRLDASQTMEVFSNLITSTDAYKNTNFYFCGFDSFTKQGYGVVKNISKVANNTNIGIVVPSNNKNNFIFDSEMLDNFESYFKDENILYNVIKIQPNLTDEQKPIFENVYSYKIQKSDNVCYDVVELPSCEDEVNFVAKKILEHTKNGGRFKDFNIATTEKYFDRIDKVFDGFGISYYIDTQKSIDQTPVYNFLSCVLYLCAYGFEKEKLIELTNNYFFDIDQDEKNDIENYIFENNIEYKKVEKLLQKFDVQKLASIISFCGEIDKKSTVKYYIEKIEKLLTDFDVENQINNLCEKFRQEGKDYLEKIYLQLFEKLQDFNDKLSNFMGDEEISVNEFFDLYTKNLAGIKISSVPLGLDCVFVGDISKSFFEKSEILCVIGANQDMPTQIKDVGLISDKDIEILSSSVKITPTAKIINKRNKFKLFDTLLQGKKLIVTYSITDSEGKKVMPSNFVGDLLLLSGNKKITQEDLRDDLLFNNPTVAQAKKNISNSSEGAVIKNALSKLGESVDFNQINRDQIQNGNLMLKQKTTVSQIESYYSCPFKHYLNYGLKLKERKNGEIKANDFGNFLHEFCKMFVDQNKAQLGTLNDEQISQSVDKICTTLSRKDEYVLLFDEENDFVLRTLKNEMLRFAQFINYEQSVTDFKIKKTEYRFADDNAIKLTVDNKDYSIIGIVDRVDFMDDYVRIVDYKTGSAGSANASISNLFYGTKIQVYVYLKAICDIFKAKPYGAFYLPISNAYTDEDKDDYKLHGYFIDDINLVKKVDKTLSPENLKSKLFEATFVNSFESLHSGRSKNVTKKQLEEMVKYSVDAVERAIQEIVNGNTAVSPIKDGCKFCEYASICAKQGSFVERNKNGEIKPEFFAKKEEWWHKKR